MWIYKAEVEFWGGKTKEFYSANALKSFTDTIRQNTIKEIVFYGDHDRILEVFTCKFKLQKAYSFARKNGF